LVENKQTILREKEGRRRAESQGEIYVCEREGGKERGRESGRDICFS
jgi:hypothetical protein